MAPSNTFIVVPLPVRFPELTTPVFVAGTVCAGFEFTIVSASDPSSTLTRVTVSETVSALTVTVTESFVPKFAEDKALVSPLPVKVTLGLVLKLELLETFCLLAVKVIELGLRVPFFASVNTKELADSLTDFASCPSNPSIVLFKLITAVVSKVSSELS